MNNVQQENCTNKNEFLRNSKYESKQQKNVISNEFDLFCLIFCGLNCDAESFS